MLHSDEVWHLTDKREWFLRVHPDIFLLSLSVAGKGYVTQPHVRLIHRGEGRWSRITVKE